MEYLVFSIAVLLLATGLRHYEPRRKDQGDADHHLLSLLGPAAHLAGSAAIGWIGGLALGAIAFVAMPLVAYAFHSLVIKPVARIRRLRARTIIADPHTR